MASSTKDGEMETEVIEGEILDADADTPSPKRNGGGGGRRAIGLLIAIVLIAGAGAYLWLAPSSPLSGFLGGEEEVAPAAIPAEPPPVAVTEADLSDLRGDVEAATAARGALAARLDDLTARVAALEAVSAAQTTPDGEDGDAPVAAVPGIDDLVARVEALEAAPSGGLEATSGETEQAIVATGLSEEMSAQLAALELRLQMLESEGQGRLSMSAATARLAVEVYAGRPYEAELVALREAARGLPPVDQAEVGPRLTALSGSAPTGIALAGELLAELELGAGEAIRADAAAAAGDGFWGRFWARLGGLITIRRRDEEPADDLGATLFAIEDSLRRGDIAGANRRAGTIEGAAASVLGEWRGRLQGAASVRAETEALLAFVESAGAAMAGDIPP